MAIKDIDDLTRPLSDLVGEQGEKAARRKKQLAEVRATRAAGMTADEAKAAAERGDFGEVGQGEERMDFLATPLVTPTDFNLAYNEPGALDYADRIDDSKKTKKPSLTGRILKGIITAAGPGKFRVGANLLLNAPDIIRGVLKKSDDVTDKIVDKKFLELFENNPLAVDSMGKFKASDSLNELLKLDATFVLGAKNPELIKLFENKGIKFNVNQISKLRTLYKKFTGKTKVSELINFDDPQVSNIMERLIVGDLTKKDAAKALDKIYPRSGFVDISMGGKADKTFTEFYESYIKNLDDDVLEILSTSKKGTPKNFFDRLNVGDKVTPKASGYLRFTTIFDDTGKNFSQTKASFLNNNIANTLINKTKNLFQDKSIQIFDVDHIQAPRFGGTNAESNLRLITKADHNSLKALPSYKTLATDVVKAKSGFENDYYKLSTRLIDNVKNNNFEAADKIAESLRVMVDNFKNTYKNVDFVVGTPHVAIKTGDNTAKYIKYGDDIKLTNKQKKYIEDNNLLPTQSNLPNAGKPIEKQAEDIYQGYLQIYNLIGEIPSGSIGKVAENIKSMDVPLPRDVVVRKEFSGLRDGGIVDIFKMTRPVDGTR